MFAEENANADSFLQNEEGFGEIFMGGVSQVQFEAAGIVSLDGRGLRPGVRTEIGCQLRQFYSGA